MQPVLFLAALSILACLVSAASPVAYGARSAASKRFASPVEARAASHPSARHEARELKPSARYVARGPHPSATPRRRAADEQTALASMDAMLCPFNMSACPVGAVSSLPKTLAEWSEVEHECVEFMTDLQSCGGCASLDKMHVPLHMTQLITAYPSFNSRHDCAAIPGVVNVACISGGCQVQSCETGYRITVDGSSCLKN